jgi:hypothetical protein
VRNDFLPFCRENSPQVHVSQIHPTRINPKNK